MERSQGSSPETPMVVHWRRSPHAHRTQHGNCYYTGERPRPAQPVAPSTLSAMTGASRKHGLFWPNSRPGSMVGAPFFASDHLPAYIAALIANSSTTEPSPVRRGPGRYEVCLLLRDESGLLMALLLRRSRAAAGPPHTPPRKTSGTPCSPTSSTWRTAGLPALLRLMRTAGRCRALRPAGLAVARFRKPHDHGYAVGLIRTIRRSDPSQGVNAFRSTWQSHIGCTPDRASRTSIVRMVGKTIARTSDAIPYEATAWDTVFPASQSLQRVPWHVGKAVIQPSDQFHPENSSAYRLRTDNDAGDPATARLSGHFFAMWAGRSESGDFVRLPTRGGVCLLGNGQNDEFHSSDTWPCFSGSAHDPVGSIVDVSGRERRGGNVPVALCHW